MHCKSQSALGTGGTDRERERERERDGGGSRRQRDKGDTDASAFGPRRNEVISLMFLLGSRLPAGHDPDAFLAFS